MKQQTHVKKKKTKPMNNEGAKLESTKGSPKVRLIN